MELNTTANVLLDLLYAQNLDKTSLGALDAPHKNEALNLLIKEGLACEREVVLDDGKYVFYDLTPEGENTYEDGGYVVPEKKSPLNIILVMCVVVVIAGIAAYLLLRSGRLQ